MERRGEEGLQSGSSDEDEEERRRGGDLSLPQDYLLRYLSRYLNRTCPVFPLPSSVISQTGKL